MAKSAVRSPNGYCRAAAASNVTTSGRPRINAVFGRRKAKENKPIPARITENGAQGSIIPARLNSRDSVSQSHHPALASSGINAPLQNTAR